MIVRNEETGATKQSVAPRLIDSYLNTHKHSNTNIETDTHAKRKA